MLLKNDEIIDKYNLLDEIKDIKKMSCWIKKEDKYNIYIFTVEIINDENLYELCKQITDNIAFDFQSKLELSVERWNIYLVLITNKYIETKVKYKIEQDIFAVRKVVCDQFIGNEEDFKGDISKFIEDKLFNVFGKEDASTNIFKDNQLQNLIKEKNSKYYSLLKIEDESEIFKEYIREYYE